MSSVVISRVLFSLGVTVTACLYHYFGSLTTHQHLRDPNLEALQVEQEGRPYLPPDDPSQDKEVLLDALYTPEADRDRIVDLPGLNYEPGFNQFAGYLTVDEDHGRHLFYWYVESQSNPVNDPVVFWTNGGPGCSGLFGLGVEHGPFFVDHVGELTANPFSWNKVASILYVEQPAGVGFSFSETKSDYHTGDSKATSDNFKLIREFYRRYPERQQNDFYVASESYGGHYMPQLTMEILKHNHKDRIIPNFAGMILGNPYVDLFTNTVTQFASMYARGLLAKPLYDQWKNVCIHRKQYQSPECAELGQEMLQQLGKGINPYGLDFPVCNDEGHHRGRGKISLAQSIQILNRTTGGPPFLPAEDDYKPCSEVRFTNYLSRGEVREALHVNTTSKWKPCSSKIHYSYKDYGTTQVDLFCELIHMGRKAKHNLRILIYSGDDDSVCSTAGTQEWIYDLGAPRKKHSWKSWHVEGQTAGFLTHFDMGKRSDASFIFATVHGAGHEVPSFRPMEAFQLFSYYLREEL